MKPFEVQVRYQKDKRYKRINIIVTGEINIDTNWAHIDTESEKRLESFGVCSNEVLERIESCRA